MAMSVSLLAGDNGFPLENEDMTEVPRVITEQTFGFLQSGSGVILVVGSPVKPEKVCNSFVRQVCSCTPAMIGAGYQFWSYWWIMSNSISPGTRVP